MYAIIRRAYMYLIHQKLREKKNLKLNFKKVRSQSNKKNTKYDVYNEIIVLKAVVTLYRTLGFFFFFSFLARGLLQQIL